MSWEEATHCWADQSGPDDGFYVQVACSTWTYAVLAIDLFSSQLRCCPWLLRLAGANIDVYGNSNGDDDNYSDSQLSRHPGVNLFVLSPSTML